MSELPCTAPTRTDAHAPRARLSLPAILLAIVLLQALVIAVGLHVIARIVQADAA